MILADLSQLRRPLYYTRFPSTALTIVSCAGERPVLRIVFRPERGVRLLGELLLYAGSGIKTTSTRDDRRCYRCLIVTRTPYEASQGEFYHMIRSVVIMITELT
jgi:hypothetical protein